MVWATALLLLLSACGFAAQQTDAQKASALLSAGLRAHVSGRTAEAADDYHKVLVYDPRNKWALYNLGLLDQLAGRATSAEREYRAALVVDPDFVGALYNLAILRTSAAPQEATDLYRHAISVKPDYAVAYLNLGFLLISEGQPAEGRAQFDRAMALDPSLAKRIPQPAPTASPKPKK